VQACQISKFTVSQCIFDLCSVCGKATRKDVIVLVKSTV
jgi:hypothetical protein